MRGNVLLASALFGASVLTAPIQGQSAVSPDARQVHDRAIVIDTHDDTTQRLIFDTSFDIGARHTDGSIDIPRMREGGLDAIFFSIYTAGDVTGPTAVVRALQQIDAVREMVRTHPRDLVLATSVAEIRRAANDGRIAALMGVEGGHMINEDLGVLRTFAALGVRYLTLTHSLNTTWADSSGDKPAHNGLTAFGRDVVRELNRVGVMVDVSHVADKTFYDVLEVTRAPVLASHSSLRSVSNHPRNMTDDMLRALAKNGGVVMINYNAPFLDESYRVAIARPEWRARVNAVNTMCGRDEVCAILGRQRMEQDAMRAGQLPRVGWEKIVEHIDRAVKVAGIDHVGLGSDFDGAVMPLGMEDASKLPTITDALLKKGYTEADVARILGGNVLRVMEQVERVAATRLGPATVPGQVATHPLDLNVTPSADTFRLATQEYRDIWSREGGRIVAAMERRTGLRFEPGPIDVSVYEGTSYSGEPGGRPMLLRASYPEATKRGTLVHELGHRLASEIVVPFDHHEVIDLFVYDVWIDLWGQAFADEQIAVESKRNGADYAGMWKKTLAMSPEERARRLQEVIKQYRKPRG